MKIKHGANELVFYDGEDNETRLQTFAQLRAYFDDSLVAFLSKEKPIYEKWSFSEPKNFVRYYIRRTIEISKQFHRGVNRTQRNVDSFNNYMRSVERRHFRLR